MQPRPQESGMCYMRDMFIIIMMIGVLAAILIPFCLKGVEQTRQQRSMRQMLTIVSALDQYLSQHDGQLPEADSLDELAHYLEPRHLESMPSLMNSAISNSLWRSTKLLTKSSLLF